MSDPMAMLYALQEQVCRLQEELALRPLEAGGGSDTFLYQILHGQAVGVYGEEGIIALEAEPTECDANFSIWTQQGVITDDTTLPDGFGVARKYGGGLVWVCNYNASGLTFDLLNGDSSLMYNTLTLDIAGGSGSVTFYLPHGFAQ